MYQITQSFHFYTIMQATNFPLCQYIIYSHFIFQTKDIYQIVKFTLQPNLTKENYLAH